MVQNTYVFDPTADDQQSKVRGIGRYLQLLKENFPKWIFINNVTMKSFNNEVIFINPFFNFLQPPLVMKRITKKQIAVIHDLIPLKYPKNFLAGIKGSINIFLNKLALKNYDIIVTDSAASKKDIIQILKIEESRVKVIYPCLPKSFNENYKLKIESFCIYVGDVTWNKNLANLAKAIKIADVQCLFVGKAFEKKPDRNNSWLQEYNEFIELTKGDKRFVLKGFVSDYELVKFYQQAKVNILVSRDEGFGFSYLEAAQFDCPSILSNIPVLKEISNNQGAIFTNPDNPNDIADKLKKVFSDDKLRNKLSLEAQQQALKFSREIFKKNWLTNLK